MNIFFFILGLAECALLWFLKNRGEHLRQSLELEQAAARHMPPGGWPPCALIVPAAGSHANMAASLRSLCEQNYPDYTLYLVTATNIDPACEIIAVLKQEYPEVRHVVAGLTDKCGQKNRNQLAGVEAANGAEILAFCDSTHFAGPDFLRCLVAPIAMEEAEFTTGYHEVEPKDQGILSLAYALCVMFMRFMQAIPNLAQPWGGAMAMSHKAYKKYQVAALWQRNVVDDCSLAAMLQLQGLKVRLCPAALLRTWTINHPFAVWRAWLERQILFLKFCIPFQWLGLGLLSLIMVAPLIWGFGVCAEGIFGDGSGTGAFLALCFFCLICWILNGWRVFLTYDPPIGRWLVAFMCACLMFMVVFLGTLFAHTILWHNILYRVGKGGQVLGMERL